MKNNYFQKKLQKGLCSADEIYNPVTKRCVKRSGASCKGSVTSLRAKAKKASGERKKMYHWCANMKSGRKKK